MSIDNILELFKRSPTIEILTVERLKNYLEKGIKLKHYIGYEISGFLHLGTGIVPIHKIIDLQKAGIKTTIFLADYHSWINKKLGGDLDTIRRIAVSYYKETFKRVIDILGGDSEKTDFILASEFYEKLGIDYFKYILKISMNISLSRAKRSISILGRRAGESLSLAQLLYVPMQVSDIFSLGVNIAHGGIDQRKAHVIAIDVGDEIGYKPIALHHGLLMGIGMSKEDIRSLKSAEESGDRDKLMNVIMSIKMSKSLPKTAIFLHDSEETIKDKIRKAYCPPYETKYNPVLSIYNYIIYPYLKRIGESFTIKNEKTGEIREYTDVKSLYNDYSNGYIHPLDLKNSVIDHLNRILKPIQRYFESSGKKYIEEMNEIMITR